MKITGLSAQARNPDRVNVMVDGQYRLSLDISQVVELGVRVGREYSADELAELETESQFGKLYARALEYVMMRPHSAREVRDYLSRKTRSTKARSKRTGQLYDRPGVAQAVAERVYQRLLERGYLDDEKFARYWIENRNLKQGVSRRKLQAELAAKGVDRDIIERQLAASVRSDTEELAKIIAKKRHRYADERKLAAYLARQGFSYDDITAALKVTGDDD